MTELILIIGLLVDLLTFLMFFFISAEDRNDVDNAEPERKRFRSQTEGGVDEPDNLNSLNISPNLKTLFTMAKLEDWVSDPENNQKLIDDLEKKLAQGEMEGLEDYLEDKKLKKSLCITAKEIKEIRRKRELKLFLEQKEKAKFPKSMLGLFFEKDKDHVTPAKVSMLVENDDEEESMQINAEESGSSGYGSQSQTNDQLELATSLHTISHPRDTDVPCSEKKTSNGESKNADLDCVMPAEELGSRSLLTRDPTVIQKKDKLLPTEDLQEVQFKNTPQTSDVPKSEKDVYDGHQNKCCGTSLPAVVDEPMQNKGLQELQCKERSGSDVPNHPDVLDIHQGQIKCYGTSLPAVADDLMQNEELQDLQCKERNGSDVLKHSDVFDGDQNENYGTSLHAVVDEPMQNEGLQERQCKERKGSDILNHPDDARQNMDIQENVYEPNEHFNPTSVYSGFSDPAVNSVTDQDKVQSLGHAESFSELFPTDNQSTPLNETKKRNNNRKKVLKENKLKKMKKMTDRDIVLRNWAMKQCSGNEGEIKEVFDCILISDVVEHSEYSFLKAENVMNYKNPKTGVNKMIYLTDEKKLSIDTKTLLQFNMYVCDIPTTIVLGPQEEERSIDRSFTIDQYLWCISKVFVPALAVYKKIQREKKLYSLI
ncbi:uncharacterized protein LOC134320932 [Trichomycterus rosablanca]|uniref:uncharacterized protein LOC134320932 n=1 Tax=Trichomycterus rosablanca TaxID=2290929 RepID=UPI002F357631